MSADHKCDMFCLWEDLDSRYKKCKNCVHNRENYSYPLKDNRVDIPFMDEGDYPHLWDNSNPEMDYNEYKKWLEKKYHEVY